MDRKQFRIARAKTGRKKFLRFEGHYHGWLDNVAWGISTPSAEALGEREHPKVYPWSEGLPSDAKDEFIILPWNDIELLKKTVERDYRDIAAIITEPIMCNNSCILPTEGFMQGLREVCDRYGIALIFDEVITGFRIDLRGAQHYFNVIPDLSVLAKAMGSGYPISVVPGKKSWMSQVEDSKVIHAGTMNAGNPSVAAALSTIEVLEREQPYSRMFALGKRLMEGLQEAASIHGQNLLIQEPGPMFHTGFTHLDIVKDYRDTLTYDKAKLGKFISAMHDRKIRVIGRGLWYISAAHRQEDIGHAIEVASEVLGSL